MGNPEAPSALPVADDLDESHRDAAIRNGADAMARMAEMIRIANERHIGAQAVQTTLTENISA